MTVMYAQDSMEEFLLDCSDADFRDVVNRDLRKQTTPDESAALRSTEVVDRWYGYLVATSKNVDGQLSAARQDWRATKARLQIKMDNATTAEDKRRIRREWAESEERFAFTRVGVLRFKSGLDEWIIHARTLRSSTEVTTTHRLRELEQAIADHQASFPGEDEPSSADEQLWKLLS